MLKVSANRTTSFCFGSIDTSDALKGLAFHTGSARFAENPNIFSETHGAYGILSRKLVKKWNREATSAYFGSKPTKRSLSDKPFFLTKAFLTSIFIRAISTPVGHSLRHPLHETQRSIVSAMSWLENASVPNCPVKANLRVFALPLVKCCSSFVTR